jgi:hypothetical protein
MPGIIAAIQTFGDKVNFHRYLHFLVAEGGVDEAGVFHKISRIDDSRLSELFAIEVLGELVHKELLSPEWAERILSWRHTGFNVHNRVRTKTEKEAERVGKYMIFCRWNGSPSRSKGGRSPTGMEKGRKRWSAGITWSLSPGSLPISQTKAKSL